MRKVERLFRSWPLLTFKMLSKNNGNRVILHCTSLLNRGLELEIPTPHPVISEEARDENGSSLAAEDVTTVERSVMDEQRT